jgi:hypothetical protein
MTNNQKLVRDINTLLESIKFDLFDLSNPSLRASERRGIKLHICWCLDACKDLIATRDSSITGENLRF